MVGPQYPLLFLSTTFEPDTAFLLHEGEMFFQFSYTALNTYVYSTNSEVTDSGVIFLPRESDSYSVYFDGELDRRFFRFYYGYSDYIELQYTYRDIRFFPGSLDSTIENFHGFIGTGNQGRENTERNLLEIYIYDNQEENVVFSLTESTAKFHQESMTFGAKLLIQETADESISFVISSNFNDYYIERGINDATGDEKDDDHGNFNDYCFTLRYTSLFPDWTLHASVAVGNIGNSLFERSPKELMYFFVGANWHLSENWDFLLQVLEYSSPFPKENTSTIAADIREITTGFRWLIGNNFAIDIGMVENQSQGPQNVDIVFFSNFMFYL
ncbi:MAG: DUF3187 family protein [Proteobacteria bacterium]|nr:DUF3187 family protein [Pseudomonadota bacterium]